MFRLFSPLLGFDCKVIETALRCISTFGGMFSTRTNILYVPDMVFPRNNFLHNKNMTIQNHFNLRLPCAHSVEEQDEWSLRHHLENSHQLLVNNVQCSGYRVWHLYWFRNEYPKTILGTTWRIPTSFYIVNSLRCSVQCRVWHFDTNKFIFVQKKTLW